jgi:dolichyl-diphosphooligosaccharide--protein glycosyltransferase
MDLQILIFVFPAGVILCFRELRDEHVFVIIYAVMASYFAGVMVRLMLTLTPVVCVSAAVAFSSLFDTYIDVATPPEADGKTETNKVDVNSSTTSKKAKKAAASKAASSPISKLVTGTTSSKKKS